MKCTLVVLFSLLAICLNLTPGTAAQQFVSSRTVASSRFGPLCGVGDFNGDGRLDFLTTGPTVMLVT